MADSKVSALVAKSTLDGTELTYVVDDPGGTPVSKRTTTQAIANLVGQNLWAGRVSQSGTSDPTVTEIADPLGYTVVATRNAVGNYSLYFNVGPAFTVADVLLMTSGANAGFVRPQVSTDNEILVFTYNLSNELADEILGNTYFYLRFF